MVAVIVGLLAGGPVGRFKVAASRDGAVDRSATERSMIPAPPQRPGDRRHRRVARLAVLLVIQKGETRHWKKQSAQFEQLYRGEQAAFAGTVANYRAAAETARAADSANAAARRRRAARHQRKDRQ